MSTSDSGIRQIHPFSSQTGYTPLDQANTAPETPPAVITPDSHASHRHLYAGTVFEYRGTLSQQLLAMLKPTVTNPELFMVDMLLEKVKKASSTLRRHAHKKGSHCQAAVQILEEEEVLSDLLYSYRSALYSG